MKFLFLTLFALVAQAAQFSGHFQTQEVEPVFNRQYVSRSCTRVEWRDCNCQNGTCARCSQNVPYDCGNYEIVRTGSRPIYELEVDYQINLAGEPLTSSLEMLSDKEIDAGYTPESLLLTHLKRPTTTQIIYAQNTQLQLNQIHESASGVGVKNYILTSDWFAVDESKMDGMFKKSKIVTKKEIRIDPSLANYPLTLNLCVGQDRIIVRNSKLIGCQVFQPAQIATGKLTLTEINFDLARDKMDLFYYFGWRLKGTWITGKQAAEAPYIILRR